MTDNRAKPLLTPAQRVLADRLIVVINNHRPADAFLAMISIMAATTNNQHTAADAKIIAESYAELLVETVERGQRGELTTNQEGAPAVIDARFVL